MSTTLKQYRDARGLSLEQFGALIGKSKAHLSAIEKHSACSAKTALEIERATGGLVDAASLNGEIREARKAVA